MCIRSICKALSVKQFCQTCWKVFHLVTTVISFFFFHFREETIFLSFFLLLNFNSCQHQFFEIFFGAGLDPVLPGEAVLPGEFLLREFPGTQDEQACSADGRQ